MLEHVRGILKPNYETEHLLYTATTRSSYFLGNWKPKFSAAWLGSL